MRTGASNNLVLTGFMGTGKTAVGKASAQRLGRPFVDMDAEIETRAQKSIPQIFAQDGEAAFRSWEARLCHELSAQTGLVIATGGGALIDAANRRRMMASGTVICLTCHPDQILQRVMADKGTDRPLLNVADPDAQIRELLRKRIRAYRAIPWQIDTTELSIDETVARVVAIASAITLSVRHPNGEYPIMIGNGFLPQLGGALRASAVPVGGLVAVVSSTVVASLYWDQVKAALRSAGLVSFLCSIPDGERHKSLDTVSRLYESLLAGGLDRGGTVLALGGGVTGDVAGFAAATFMRGVRLVQCPTTLLAMVDASVGGKTGVDLPQGKNLVGAFKQPAAVVIDPHVLVTLPEPELRSGLAEIIKHGVIGAPDLFTELETGNGTLASWWGENAAARIARAVQVKIDVVEEDPFERGRRAVLNLGHTLGHGLERLSGFSLRHGEAVAIGMVAAARIAARMALAKPSLADRIAATLHRWGLPTACPPFDADAVWKAMAHDKKRSRSGLRWVLPHDIGYVQLHEHVPRQLVESVLLEMMARSGE